MKRVLLIIIILSITCFLPILSTPLESTNFGPTESSSRNVGGVDPQMEFPFIDGMMGDHFTENAGQYPEEDALFYSIGAGMTVGFSKGRIDYIYRDTRSEDVARFSVSFPGSNDANPVGVSELADRTNFLLGRETTRWISGARNYEEVIFHNLWDDIDLRFYQFDGMLKYDVIIGPGANVGVVLFEFDDRVMGLELDVASHDLIIQTSAGQVRDKRPYALQSAHEVQMPIPCEFQMVSENVVGFSVPVYDATRTLVIDPGFVFKTYFGGFNSDSGADMVLGPDDSLYCTGLRKEYNQVDYDAYIYRVNASGTEIDLGLMIGGDDREEGIAIEVAADGEVFLTGKTSSSDFPVTTGAYDTTLNGTTDAFVLRLSSDLTTFRYSTLVGGNGSVTPRALEIDASGNAYVAGETAPNGVPITAGAYNNNTSGTDADAFIFKMNPDGSRLLYSSVFGGGMWDRCWCLDVDDLGQAYVGGMTSSEDFPTTSGAFCQTSDPYYYRVDAFILKLSADGTSLVFSTYITGTQQERVYDIEVVDGYEIYAAGTSGSKELPVSKGAYCETMAGSHDAFVLKLDSNGSSVDFGTYVGGSGMDRVNSICLDDEGNVFVAGYTTSSDFPVTENVTYKDDKDAFIFKLDANLSDLLFSTLVGSFDEDNAHSVAVDSMNCIDAFLTTDGSISTTENAYRSSGYGWGDLFALRFDPISPWVVEDYSPDEVYLGDPLDISIRIADNHGVEKVIIEYWTSGYSASRSKTLSVEDGDSHEGNYSLHWTEVHPYYFPTVNYTFHFEDMVGPRISTPVRTIRILDNDVPTVDDQTTGTPTTGDPYRIMCEARDSLGIDSVRIFYWYSDAPDTVLNVSMEKGLVDGVGNGEYESSGIVPSNHSLASLNYYIEAIDRLGKITRTLPKQVMVKDNDSPWLVDETLEGPVTTGDMLVVTATVEDNIGVLKVVLEYYYGQVGTGEMGVVNMTPSETSGRGNGTYSATISIPHQTKDGLNYLFVITDEAGIMLSTTAFTVLVHDNDPPEVIEDLTTGLVTTGEVFRFRVHTGDNIALESVSIFLRFDEETAKEWPMPLFEAIDYRSGVYSYALAIPGDRTPRITYQYKAVDTIGLTVVTNESQVRVLDNDRPWFGQDSTGDRAVKGMVHQFIIECYDNIGVTEVRLEYEMPDGTLERARMEPGSSWNLLYTIPRHFSGAFLYQFVAVDADGNQNATELQSIMVSNVPPTLKEGVEPSWDLDQGTEGTFPVLEYIEDVNDPVESLVVSTLGLNDDNRTISWDDGVLKGHYYIWLPDHEIQVSVYDGEDWTDVTILLHITDINFDPQVTITSPEDGVSVKEGTSVEFEGEYDDPDLPEGQLLSITWRSSLDGVLTTFEIDTAEVFNVSDLTPGVHEITVEVSDGEVMTSASVMLTILKKGTDGPGDDNDPDGPMQLSSTIIVIFVILTAIAIVVIALLIMRQSSRRID